MKTCPYCKEDVRDDAVKCRFCHSALDAGSTPAMAPAASAAPAAASSPSPSLPSPPPRPADRTVTYVVDTDLVRFAKFTAAVLAVFVVVGAYLFGFKLEAAVERVGALQREVEKTSDELKRSHTELQAAKAAVVALKADVEGVLSQAKRTLEEIGVQRDTAVAWVVSIKKLSPSQEQQLAQAKSDDPRKTRAGSASGVASKLWAPGSTLRVGFVGGSAAQRAAVEQAAVEWTKHANLNFRFVDSGPTDVRVGFDPGGGSWSFVGTDALGVAKAERTMNLAGVERSSVLHEFGHVLGLIEEHQNPLAGVRWNRSEVLRVLQRAPYSWSVALIEEQVLKQVPAQQLGDYRDFDPKSIMTFEFPAELTGGVAIGGAKELSDSDRQLVRRLYPGR